MGPPAAVIPNFGNPSPIKMHGSFLKRSVQAGRLVASSSPDRLRGRSPGQFSSPDRGRLQSPGQSKTPKRNQSPNAAAARRKLPVDEDSMQVGTLCHFNSCTIELYSKTPPFVFWSDRMLRGNPVLLWMDYSSAM